MKYLFNYNSMKLEINYSHPLVSTEDLLHDSPRMLKCINFPVNYSQPSIATDSISMDMEGQIYTH